MDTVAKMKQKTAYRAVEFGKSGRVVGLETRYWFFLAQYRYIINWKRI